MAEAATQLPAKESKPKAVQRPAQGPRPAYVLVNLPEGVTADQIEIVQTTRKAEDALEAIDTGRAAAYLRLMIK